jgi:hypothetical protein
MLSIHFLSSHELFIHLIEDSDQFYPRFNQHDLQARQCSTISEYMDMIYESVIDLSPQEQEIIKKKIQEIQQIKWPQDPNIWIDPQKFNQLPWNIGGMEGRKYEYGLPHTRSDVIIIPKEQIQDTPDFKNTLLHEKLHIYQKAFPFEFASYLQQQGWKIHQHYNECPRCRSNPDTNEYIYKYNNDIHHGIYNNNPQSVMDVTFSPKNFYNYEHPTEKYVLDLLHQLQNVFKVLE